MATTRINVKKVVLETLLVLSVGLAVLMVRQLGSPRREGFFCDDASIRLPKVPDTISDAVVALTTLLLPSVAMALSEVVRVGRVVPSGLTWRGAAIPLWLVRVYRQTGVFILGSGFTLLTVDVAKNYVGRLRPHFIAVCNPMAPQLTPSMSPGSYTKLCMSSTPGQPEFVPPLAYMCMGSKPSDERDARSSFPSGHAALAFYAAVYLALYVQSRCRRLGGSLCSLVRPIVQWLLLLAAWYITLSRIVDHMHHPTDVLVGGIIGTVFAFFQVFLVSGIFSAEGATDDQLVVLNPTKNYAPSNCV